jgi:hypothetical protein
MSIKLDDRECAALVALADGLDTLEARRMATHAERDQELRALVARQRRVAAALRAVAVDERAPPALREAIETAKRPRRQSRRRLSIALSGATALAAAVVALVLGSGKAAAPSVSAVATLASRAPAAAAPAPLPGVDGVRFPDWKEKFGWRAVGVREDRVAGRRAVTVTYENRDRTAVYTIVAGDPLPWPDAEAIVRKGTKFKAVELDGRTVVTWRRNSRTCVLSATDVPRDKLLGLAAWKP